MCSKIQYGKHSLTTTTTTTRLQDTIGVCRYLFFQNISLIEERANYTPHLFKNVYNREYRIEKTER
jgi:hypothetical protein